MKKRLLTVTLCACVLICLLPVALPVFAAEAGDTWKPEDDEYYEFAPIADPDTVPVNTPSILWDPETYGLPKVENGNVSRVKSQAGTRVDDYTWRVELTDHRPSVYVKADHNLSYAAEDFPVVGILLYNMWMETGALEYAAGDVISTTEANRVSFSVYDGKLYGSDWEYVLIPIDLTGLWSRRINALRMELNYMEDSSASFEICFMGMFRSTEEAYAYAAEWLTYDKDFYPDTATESITESFTEPPYDPPAETESPDAWDTVVPEETTAGAAPVTTEGEALEELFETYGCTGSMGAVALLTAMAAALIMAKKKS